MKDIKLYILFSLFFTLSIIAHAASGFYSWHYVAFLATNFALPTEVATPFLVGLEVCKHLFFSFWLTGVFWQESSRAVNAYTGIGAMLLYTFSIVCALQGAGLHTAKKYDLSQTINQNVAQSIQEIKQDFGKKIEIYEAQIAQLNALQATRQSHSVYWGLDSTDKVQLAFCQAQIIAIQRQANEATARLQNQEIGQIKENTARVSLASVSQFYLSGIVEIVLLIFTSASTYFFKNIKFGNFSKWLLPSNNPVQNTLNINFAQFNNLYANIEIPKGYEPILQKISEGKNQPEQTDLKIMNEFLLQKPKYYEIKKWLPIYELKEKIKLEV